MVDSSDVDKAMVASRARVRKMHEEFLDRFYGKQRHAAISAWWATVPDPFKQLIQQNDPELFEKMESGNYGTKG